MWDNFLHIFQIRQTLGTENRLETLPVMKMDQVQLKFYDLNMLKFCIQSFLFYFIFWLVFCEKLINLCGLTVFIYKLYE